MSSTAPTKLAGRAQRALLERGLLTLGSMVLSLLAIESGLRAWRPLSPELAVHVHRRPDPLLGWRLEPNLDLVVEKPSGSVRVTTNARGFRDGDHGEGGRAFRLVILGDSFMEAIQVDRSAAFPSQLQEHLKDLRKESVESINLGVSGFGTLQEALAFETEGARFHPDVVLLGFYLHNDLTDNAKELEDAVQRRSAHRPYMDLNGEVTSPNFDEATRIFAVTRRELTWRTWGLFQAGLTSLASPDPAHRDRALIAYSCVEAPQLSRAWELTGRILDRLRNAVDRIGGVLAVFSVPSRLEVDASYRAANTLGLPQGFCFDEPPGWRRLESLLVARSIPYIDLRPAFHRRANLTSGSDLYGAGDDHWNETGHELAASVVSRAAATWKLGQRFRANKGTTR